MAEWLGQLMSGWPAWAVFGTLILIIIIGGVISFYIAGTYGSGVVPNMWRKKHAKK